MGGLSYKTIGRCLRDARKKLQLKQVDVARLTDVSLPYYGRVERGEICPSIKRLHKICEVLDLPLADVFKGTPSPKETCKNITLPLTGFEAFFLDIAHESSRNYIKSRWRRWQMFLCHTMEKLNAVRYVQGSLD